VDGFTFSEIPAGFQDWREGFDHGGIWQPVTLLATGLVYAADAFLAPNIESSSVEIQLSIVNAGQRPFDGEINVEFRPWKDDTGAVGGASTRVKVEPGTTSFQLTARIPNARLWSAVDPFLYRATVSIRSAGRIVDDLTARFGMRQFAVGKDGAFHLNGQPIFVKGAHYQSTEPMTLAFPRNIEAARQIVEIAKEGGFNFIRGQGRPTAPAILDAADELGILFQCEPAVSKMPDNRNMEALAEREVTEMVRRDRNHPCVVIWNMINEQAAGMKVVNRMCEIARKLDPTRLITESAGGNSRYYPPGSADGVSYLTEHYYPGAPLPEGMLQYLRERGVAGQLYFVTEFGYGGLEDVDAVLEQYGRKPLTHMEDYQGFARQKREVEESYEGSGLKDIFPALAAFREAAQSVQANAVRLHVEAMRCNPRLRGYNIVQLFDSNSNEVDGLVDFWRNRRKKAFAAIQELNQPLGLIVQASPFNVEAGQDVDVTVTLVNEYRVSGSHRVRVSARDQAGRVLYSRENSFEARPVASVAFQGKIPAGARQGRLTIEAEIAGGSFALKRSATVDVYDRAKFRWPGSGFTLFDPQHQWRYQKPDVKTKKFDAMAGTPTVVVVPAFNALWRKQIEFREFLDLVEQARRGSTVLFLGVPADGAVPEQFRRLHFHLQFSPLTVASVLGFRIDVVGGRGGWGRLVGPYGGGSGEAAAGSPVMRHPIFEGCPGPGLMDWEYGNVATDQVMQLSISPVERTGPTIQIVPIGSGRVAFCTLRLLENLGRDALAEKLLSNLIGYLDSSLPERLRPQTPRDAEAFQFRLAQVRDCFEKFLRG
jgi:hypothetical protein